MAAEGFGLFGFFGSFGSLSRSVEGAADLVARVREDLRDWLLLMGKSVLMVIGGILVLGGLVDVIVLRGSLRGAAALAVGLLLAVPPLAFAFRDAAREARKGRL